MTDRHHSTTTHKLAEFIVGLDASDIPAAAIDIDAHDKLFSLVPDHEWLLPTGDARLASIDESLDLTSKLDRPSR